MDSKEPINDRVEQSGPTDGTAHRTLGRYQIQEELGRGAMGAVYKAFDPVIARTVALKTILIDDRAPDRAQMIERLKQEAKAAGGLDHPNIITIYDVGDENGTVYLSMQFVKGTTLADLLANAGVPSLPTLLSWADQILAAVGFAHARGVIHRDLKPANLMVTGEGTIKVLDFGIAKIENTSLTQTGLVIGTPGYMSPEQIVGKKIDHRADIFSLGAVFYELLTRERPFAGDIATILYKIVNEDPVAPSLINPAIPGGIDAVIRKALAKDPKDRFQTCEEMRQAFLEQSIGAPLNPPAVISAEKRDAERLPGPASARHVPQFPVSASRLWPRLIFVSALLFVATASWTLYVHSLTGAFPPFVAKLESKITPLAPDARKASGGDDHSATPVRAQAPEEADAVATVSQTSATPSGSGAATAPALQTAVSQSSSDHPTSENAPVSGIQAPSPPADTPEKSNDSSQTPSSKTADSEDNDHPTADKVAANDPFAPSSSSREGDRQGEPLSTPKSSLRKRAGESAMTVDGFSRQDIPDLLSQAYSSTTRGDYRLARYEYLLVLRLDRGNVQAREGLRRLPAVWQSR